MKVCPGCGGENPDRFRHCGYCGASLAAPEVERRKLATFVFCDLTGSTAMGERVDAESMRDLLRSYFLAMRGAVERHGGIVEKFIGDAVVAAFGVAESHEDDAMRACRAALEMQERIVALNEGLERRFGASIAVSIGVNTGEVVTSAVTGTESFATGDAVNVAARLEQAAAAGEVLLGEATYRLVREAVQALELEPVAAKGKSESVIAYRLLGVNRPGPAPRRIGTPFAGRADELRLLERAFEQTLDRQGCRLVTVIAEPGVGKSRLATELITRIGTRARVARGTCLSYGEGVTFWAIAQIVRDLAGIRDEHSVAEARTLIHSRVAHVESGPEIAAKIAQLLGLEAGAATLQETTWAVRHFLIAQADTDPLIILVDDIHWADETLRDLLADLPAAIGDAPIMLLCLSRPELLQERPDWPVSIRLEPLNEHGVDMLLESLLGTASAAVRLRIATASQGNPLFIEELVAMLLEEGVLRVDDGICTVIGNLDAIALPASLHALLGARLDRLDPADRDTLERGAIEGEVFHRGAVVALSEPALRIHVPESLEALAAKDIVRSARASFVGEDAFRFKHILVRDATYQATAKKLRAALHEQFAAWLERAAGDRVTEYDEIIGYHLAQSYHYRTELGPVDAEIRAIGGRAARRLAAAGDRAGARGDARAASSLLATAAKLAPRPVERAEYALRHGAAALEAGAFATAEEVLTRVRSDAAEAGWAGIEASADVELALLMSLVSPRESAPRMREVGRSALSVFETLEDDRGMVVALLLLSRERWQATRCADSEDILERALPLAERSGEQRLVTAVLTALARATAFGPRPAGAGASRCESLLERARTIGPTAVATISFYLAVLEASLGNTSRARALATQSKTVLSDLALDFWVAGSGQLVGIASLIAGDPEHAEDELRTAGELLEKLGERDVASSVAALRARALVELGRPAEGEGFALTALSWAADNDVFSHAYASGALARSMAARGLPVEAVANARHAVELSTGSDLLNMRADALLDLALVLDATGDRVDAREAADAALALYRAKENVVSAERTQRLLSSWT